MSKVELEKAGTVLGPAVSQAAGTCGAIVLTGGTDAGVMRMVGAARRDNPRAMPLLVGVAPRGKVDPEGKTLLERNHTHTLLADSAEWGGETPLLFDVAAALSGTAPAVVVLANGEEHSRAEALEAVRRGWPLVVVQGLGGVADDIVTAKGLEKKALKRSPLRRLATYDRLAVRKDAIALTECLTWELTDEPALIQAWRIYTAYDEQAKRLQTTYRWYEAAIILVGILATFLAVAHGFANSWAQDRLHWVLVALPTIIGVAIAWAGRRAFGKRWVLLRAAAEAVKGETYRYRTRARPYVTDERPGAVLADRLAAISRQLDGTEAVSAALQRPERVGPPGKVVSDSLRTLDPVAYAHHRVSDQIDYYRLRAGEKAKTRDRLVLATLGAGGLGTVLAAAGVEPGVAVTTALSTGAGSFVSSLQYERDVGVYNQSAAELEAVYLEWSERRDDDDAAGRLVDRAETILTEEVGDWARRMARAMDEETRRPR
jgi:hypothetical protein